MCFLVRKKDMREIIPDLEFVKYKEVCYNMIYKLSSCHEAHFALARLLAHEGKFELALQHLRIALQDDSGDHMYKVWYATIMVLCMDNLETAKEAFVTCQKLLQEGHLMIEVFWCLMEISLRNFLTDKKGIENPRAYATSIMQIDRYYGYLAWSYLFLATGDKPKAESILIELVSKVPDQIEAYLKLWNFYYSEKNYEKALSVIQHAFLKVSTNTPQLNSLINLYYTKTLFRVGNYLPCFELLQLYYMKHPEYTAYLYHYGRMCLKSKSLNFLGSAISALQECTKTAADFRQGQVLFWLSEGYLQAKEKVSAYQTMKEAIPLLSESIDKLSDHQDKIYERKILAKLGILKEKIRTMQGDMVNIDILEKEVKSDLKEDSLEEIQVFCSYVKNFEEIEGALWEAEVLKKLAKKKEAIQLLHQVKDKSKVLLKPFMRLIEYFKEEKRYSEIKQVAEELIKKCHSPLVPVHTWIQAHKVYAKALVNNGEHQKALLIYKSLGQVLPELNIPDVNYTRILQSSSTMEDLTSAVSRVQRSRDLLRASKAGIGYHQSKLFINRRNLSSFVMQMPQEPRESIGSRTPKPLPEAESNCRPTGHFANSVFSVSSDYSFLYNLGKICAKFGLELEEGNQALHDFLNFHVYWMKEGIEADEVKKVKAQYWRGVVLDKLGKKLEAMQIFKEILSLVFELGLEEMTKNIQEYFKDNRGILNEGY